MLSFEVQQGNCLRLLPYVENESIACVVTSPPYNKRRKTTDGNVKYDGRLSEEKYQRQQIEMLELLYKKVKLGGSCFYVHKIRHVNYDSISPWAWLQQTSWKIRQEIIWNRHCGYEMSGQRFLQTDERIYWLTKDLCDYSLNSRHRNYNSIWNLPRETRRLHSFPMPLSIPIRCIEAVSPRKGEIILDPYCGSGTTGVAARMLGYSFLGFDTLKKCVETSWNRLNTFNEEDLRLFQEYSCGGRNSYETPLDLILND